MWLINRIRNWWARRFSPRPLYWGTVTIPSGKKKGVNHLTSHDDEHKYDLQSFNRKLQWAVEAGVQLSRGPHIAPWCMEKPGHIGKLRAMVEMMAEVGIQSVPVVFPDADITETEWARHCRAVAHEFNCDYFSVMNEPDNDPKWALTYTAAINMEGELAVRTFRSGIYPQWLHIAASELRAVRPVSLICAPSLGHGKASAPEVFLPALDSADFDIFTIHPYKPPGQTAREYVNKCLELVRDKPVWIEEDGATENVEAAIRGSYKYYLEHPRIEAVFWYCLCNYSPDQWKWNLLKPYFESANVMSPSFWSTPAFEAFKAIR